MSDSSQADFESMVGKLVVEAGLATLDDVEEIEKLQQANGSDRANFTELLIKQGVVTRRQIERLKPRFDDEHRGSPQQIPGFQIIKRLGQGAMATVYLARQMSLDRLVAIKVLPRKYSDNEEYIRRFYEEGRAAAKLNHPNIVAALDVGHAGDFHYFVMEYVKGKSLYDGISSHRQYTEDEALNIVTQVARALHHAHKAGFIHRDVKPKNIMITGDGVVKLADMGLARPVDDREAAESERGKAYGTPYYISPEQIRGEIDVDFRADIYGLGATFYNIVTGRVPFEGPNPSAVMHKHLKSELVPPDHINAKLSAGVGEIVETCMAKDKDERYASTEDLLEDLEAVARGEPPRQARKKFDLSSLAELEKSATDLAVPQELQPDDDQDAEARDLQSQPLFWIALTGWGIALLMLAIYMNSG